MLLRTVLFTLFVTLLTACSDNIEQTSADPFGDTDSPLNNFTGQYILDNMFVQLNADATGQINYNNVNNIDVTWGVSGRDIIIIPIVPVTGGPLMFTSFEWNSDAQANYAYDTNLQRLTINVRQRQARFIEVEYELESITIARNDDRPAETQSDSYKSRRLYDQSQLLAFSTEELAGNWYVEFIDPEISQRTLEVSLLEGGTGSFLVEGNIYNLTWFLDTNNLLTIDVPDYTFYDNAQSAEQQGFSTSFYLTERNETFLTTSQKGSSKIVASRLFKKQPIDGFTFDEAATGWAVDTTSPAYPDGWKSVYDLYPDGEFFWGWGYSFHNEWRIENGEIVRFSTVCGSVYPECVEHTRFIHTKIASEAGSFHVLRQIFQLNQTLFQDTGTKEYLFAGGNIFKMKRNDHFGETEFNENFDNSFSFVVSEAAPTSSITWQFVGTEDWYHEPLQLPEDGLRYLLRDTGGANESFSFDFIDGQISYVENGIERRLAVMETARHYLKVCSNTASEINTNCSSGEVLYFYRNQERAQQHVEYGEVSSDARFVNSTVVEKGFELTDDLDGVLGFYFSENGTGQIAYADQISSITWSVTPSGSLNITENKSNGETIIWNLVAESNSTTLTFKYTVNGTQGTGSMQISGDADNDGVVDIIDFYPFDPTESTERSAIKVTYNPAAGQVSIPNDLLFSGSIDGTLQTQVETSDSTDFGNPETALGTLDGWGNHSPFNISLDFDAGKTIDTSTINNPDSVKVFQVKMYSPDQTDPDCLDSTKLGLICKGVSELIFGVDYVMVLSNGGLTIVPLRVFPSNASFLVALTKELKDSDGLSLLPSDTYKVLKPNIDEHPIVPAELSDDELDSGQLGTRTLQKIISSYEAVLIDEFAMEFNNIIYTQLFTTQSGNQVATDPLQVIKLLEAQQYAAEAQADPNSVALAMASEGVSVAEVLAASGSIPNDPAQAIYQLYNSADLYSANIDLPYYLEDSSGDPLKGFWRSACDSGIILQQLTQEQINALTPGTNQNLCASLGLADLGVDTDRYLTKYNPVPQVNSVQSTELQFTIPNVTAANLVRSQLGLPNLVGKPAGGWPIVVLQHGITSKKEDMLALTGYLSVYGLATVSMDLPLHGSREFATTNGTVGATTERPYHFLNLQSLLTFRDNIRQAVADNLRLRLRLNNVVDATDFLADGSSPLVTNIIDANKVSFLGHSLGSVTGSVFAAVSNGPLAGSLDSATQTQIQALYKLTSIGLASPSSSFINSLVESAVFSPTVNGSIILGLNNSLSDKMLSYLQAGHPSNCITNPDIDIAVACAYSTLLSEATPQEFNDISQGISEFTFVAQSILDSADPLTYTNILNQLNTPILMTEMIGDGLENLSDQVFPNTLGGKPLGASSGLAALMGLSQISETTNSVSPHKAIVRFKIGSHSTLLTPTTTLSGNYPLAFANVNEGMQVLFSNFFATEGLGIILSGAMQNDCAIKGGNLGSCPE